MDKDLSYEYTESFDSFVSDSGKNVKSVVTELESCDASLQRRSVDTDCLSPLSTDRSHSSVDRRTANLSASHSTLRFSRYFSRSGSYSADFTGSGANLNSYYSSFESSSDGAKDESDKEESVLTVYSASSDTETYSSVSQEPSVSWKNGDEVEEFFSDSQQLSSHNSCNVLR